MNDQHSLNNIDNLLFQLALQTRELSQKKNEINQQIKVCRGDIAERKTYIETTHRNINKLEEEITVKQNTVRHYRENAKSMKATNNLLLQYEKTLKAELERREESYNQDMEVYEERIASYRKVFQERKEHYCQNPLAKKLLSLQAEKEEIECRIKACEDLITIKQKELDTLVGQIVNSSSTEKPPDSISDELTITEPEKQSGHQTEKDINPPIDISSLHLAPTKEEQSTMSGIEEGMAAEMEDRVAVEEEQASVVTDVEDNEGVTAFPQSTPPPRTKPQSSPARMKVMSSTPTFSLNPSSSPCEGTSEGKSPAFLFSMNSDPSTPSFSGFGFDIGSAQEDSSFTFTSSYFSDKVPHFHCFLFDQTEWGEEEFQFSFASKSPQMATADQDKTSGDEFPFSFNF
ncbi:shootin-1 [Centroberyx affinis]|uniref:shootin-1 n=1 Tax=Centroberyx affinis TaxID=166261 RepID=UPI003A5C3C30